MYKSPIEIIYGEMETRMVQETEEMIVKAVRNVGVNVDKSELIKALSYDRERYKQGFEDGRKSILEDIRQLINSNEYPEDLEMDLCDYMEEHET